MFRRRMLAAATGTIVVVAVGFAAVRGGGWGGDDPARDAGRGTSASSGTTPGTSSEGRISAESEVLRQPEGSAKKGLPGMSDDKPTTKGALIGRLPRTASSRGAVVAGFPLSVIPVPSGSAVRSSGVSSTSKILQVSIVSDSSRSRSGILAFYRAALSERGFVESKAPAVAGSTAARFRRDADHLVVTVTSASRTRTTFSLFGTLHAGKRG